MRTSVRRSYLVVHLLAILFALLPLTPLCEGHLLASDRAGMGCTAHDAEPSAPVAPLHGSCDHHIDGDHGNGSEGFLGSASGVVPPYVHEGLVRTAPHGEPLSPLRDIPTPVPISG